MALGSGWLESLGKGGTEYSSELTSTPPGVLTLHSLKFDVQVSSTLAQFLRAPLLHLELRYAHCMSGPGDQAHVC
jgi:hypothetical protein